MHSYLNLETQPVFIPDHSVARKLTRDINDKDTGDMSKEGHDWLKVVLSSENIPYDEDFGISPTDHAMSFEEVEYAAYVMSVAITTLTPEEWSIVKLRYWYGMTQDGVGEALNQNKMWVSRHEKAALDKLKETLCNN